jgi:hypothetical protein
MSRIDTLTALKLVASHLVVVRTSQISQDLETGQLTRGFPYI